MSLERGFFDRSWLLDRSWLPDRSWLRDRSWLPDRSRLLDSSGILVRSGFLFDRRFSFDRARRVLDQRDGSAIEGDGFWFARLCDRAEALARAITPCDCKVSSSGTQLWSDAPGVRTPSNGGVEVRGDSETGASDTPLGHSSRLDGRPHRAARGRRRTVESSCGASDTLGCRAVRRKRDAEPPRQQTSRRPAAPGGARPRASRSSFGAAIGTGGPCPPAAARRWATDPTTLASAHPASACTRTRSPGRHSKRSPEINP